MDKHIWEGWTVGDRQFLKSMKITDEDLDEITLRLYKPGFN